MKAPVMVRLFENGIWNRFFEEQLGIVIILLSSHLHDYFLLGKANDAVSVYRLGIDVPYVEKLGVVLYVVNGIEDRALLSRNIRSSAIFFRQCFLRINSIPEIKKRHLK